jgi:hypothetical protein
LPDAGPVGPVDAGPVGGTDAGPGGSPDAGGGGGSPDAGGGGGSPDAGGGGGSPDAGGGGGSPDAGGGGGSPDAGGGGGVAAGCEGIMPGDPGMPVTAGITPSGDDQECWAATSDESGDVAMEAHRSDANSTLITANTSRSIVHWFQFRPDGSRVGDAFASYGLFPQGSGFIGTWWEGGPPKEFVRFWSGDGQVHDNKDKPFGADDGPGMMGRGFGAGVLTATSSSFINQGFVTFRRFGPSGQQQFQDERKEVPVVGAVIGVAEPGVFGRATAAFIMPLGSGNLYVQWVELDPSSSGGRQGEEKLLATGVDPNNFLVHPFADGSGIALRINGAWAGTLAPFETTLSPPPTWLADHPDHDFAIIRGQRAYALTQSGRNSIEVISKQGNSCGSVTFPDVGGVSTGADGTVIGASGPGGCTKKWWRGLLR